jgi:hypothetical protein
MTEMLIQKSLAVQLVVRFILNFIYAIWNIHLMITWTSVLFNMLIIHSLNIFRYKCPVCSKSICDMSSVWKKLDQAVMLCRCYFFIIIAFGIHIIVCILIFVRCPQHQCLNHTEIRRYVNSKAHGHKYRTRLWYWQ